MAKIDIESKITNAIINKLESGKVAPWNMPWHGAKGKGAMPLRANGEEYKGINTIILWMAKEVNGFVSNQWMTYNQASSIKTDEPKRPATDEEREFYLSLFKGSNFYTNRKHETFELGVDAVRIGNKEYIPSTKIARADTLEIQTYANVKKGETSEHVVFYKTIVKTEKAENGVDDVTFNIPLMKTFSVFNCDQIENLPSKFTVVEEDKEYQPLVGKLPHADAYFQNTGAKLDHKGSQAFYMPSQDRIQMPKFGDFKTVEGYYSTLFHELIHWTMTKERCNRNFEGSKRFGGKGYATEELTAELGACFINAKLGIEKKVRDDHASYIKSWLKALKNDKKFIFTASAKASQAVEFIDSLQSTEELKEVA